MVSLWQLKKNDVKTNPNEKEINKNQRRDYDAKCEMFSSFKRKRKMPAIDPNCEQLPAKRAFDNSN